MNIRFEHITFSYDRQPVLKRVSGEIPKGGFAALVGPNGSGKSTLIKCMNGILKPHEGSLFFDGRDVEQLTARHRAQWTGYVPQSEEDAMSLSVFDTVLMGRKPHFQWHPGDRDYTVVSEVLESLRLEDISMRSIRMLSGGQRQKVFIARALAQEPKALLLDEPTANLDIRHQMEVLELLNQLSEQGITIIMAVHDINIASLYCNHVIMLKDGSVFKSGGKEVFSEGDLSELYDVTFRAYVSDGHTLLIPEPGPVKKNG